MASTYINMIYVPELAHYIFNSPSLLPEVLQKFSIGLLTILSTLLPEMSF